MAQRSITLTYSVIYLCTDLRQHHGNVLVLYDKKAKRCSGDVICAFVLL